MTAKEAVEIIEDAGLKAPKDIKNAQSNETPLNPAPIPVAADATGGTTADVGTEPVADESGGSEVEVEPVLAEEVAAAPAEEEVVVEEKTVPLTKEVWKEV